MLLQLVKGNDKILTTEEGIAHGAELLKMIHAGEPGSGRQLVKPTKVGKVQQERGRANTEAQSRVASSLAAWNGSKRESGKEAVRAARARIKEAANAARQAEKKKHRVGPVIS